MSHAAKKCCFIGLLLVSISFINSNSVAQSQTDTEAEDASYNLDYYIDTLFNASLKNFRDFRLSKVKDSSKVIPIVFPKLHMSYSVINHKRTGGSSVSIVWDEPERFYNDLRGFYNLLRQKVHTSVPFEYGRKKIDYDFPGKRMFILHEYEFSDFTKYHTNPLIELRYVEEPEAVSMTIYSAHPPEDFQSPLKGEGFLNLLGDPASDKSMKKHMLYLQENCFYRTERTMSITTEEFLHKGIALRFKGVSGEGPRVLTDVIFNNGYYSEDGYWLHYGELPFGLNFLDGKAKILQDLGYKGNPNGQKLHSNYTEYHISNVGGVEGLYCRAIFEEFHMASVEFYILPNDIALLSWNKSKKKYKFASSGL